MDGRRWNGAQDAAAGRSSSTDAQRVTVWPPGSEALQDAVTLLSDKVLCIMHSFSQTLIKT